MENTWETTIQLLAKGDKRAYAAVFREFYGSLVLYACRFIEDRDAAEDIVQGFFCRLWEGRRHLADIKFFKSYFYSSVRHSCLNYLRDRHVVSLDGLEIQKEEDFRVEMMEEEIYRELHAAIKTLPEKCRKIFLMKLEGKKNLEIAGMLDITEETVRSQLRRGRELLQKKLSPLWSLTLLVRFFSME